MASTDSELVARAQAGEVDAFAILVERHRRTIVHLAQRFVASIDDAHDLAQETFVTAFQHLSTLREGEKIGAWLRRIAVNIALRWRQREAQISLEALWEDTPMTALLGRTPPDRSAERIREIVRDAVAGLPPERRSAVLLHYFQGYDYGETAALLDVPVSTVRGRLHLARRRLREEMIELAQPKGKPQGRKERLGEFALTAADLDALRGAETTASRDATRPALQAICIEPDGTLVSTDLHRLFLYRGSSIRPPSRVLVSRSLFTPLQRRDLKQAHLTITREEATLRYGDEHGAPKAATHQAPVLPGESYPAYDRILPAEWSIAISFLARDLLESLEEVARFEAFLAASALPDSGRPAQRITLTAYGGSDRVVLQDDAVKAGPAVTQWIMSREFSARLEGLETGKEFSVGVNRHFLRDAMVALSVGPSERMEMRLNDRLGPIQIKPDGLESRFVLVMPFNPACA